VARSHGRFLYTVAYRLTGNDADAQDLVQEVLLRVRRGLATYRPGSLEAWLSRITTNAFLDETRRRKRRPSEPLPEDPDRVLAGGDDAATALASTTISEDVQAALRALPDEYRAAVVLCDVVGLPYGEIADQLAVPVGTVNVIVMVPVLVTQTFPKSARELKSSILVVTTESAFASPLGGAVHSGACCGSSSFLRAVRVPLLLVPLR